MHAKDSVDIAVALTERLLREQQMIFDRAATGILFTRDRQIQRCNPAFEAIFGWELGHMQGQPTRVMYATDQAWTENGELVYPSLSEHRRFDGELRYCNRQGQPIWCRVTVSWIRAENPDEGAVWLMEDVTLVRSANIALQDSEERVAQRAAELSLVNQELTQALATLELARDQLVKSEKLAALGSLVTGVAHELNTPIGNCATAISALDYRVAELAQLAEAGLKRSYLQSFLDDSRQTTDLIGRNITRAATLITSFKQVAVDQTGSQRRQFTLVTAIAEVLLTLKPIVAKSACRLTSDTPQDALLDSFPGPLGQVLTHLIENAMLHGYDKGQTAGAIAVETRRVDSGHVAITLRDTDRGIPAEHMLHLFEPFFTTRLGQGGSGLGLYVVHNIAAGVPGGTVDVSSVEGQGAAFTITIPTVAPGCKRALNRVGLNWFSH